MEKVVSSHQEAKQHLINLDINSVLKNYYMLQQINNCQINFTFLLLHKLFWFFNWFSKSTRLGTKWAELFISIRQCYGEAGSMHSSSYVQHVKHSQRDNQFSCHTHVVHSNFKTLNFMQLLVAWSVCVGWLIHLPFSFTWLDLSTKMLNGNCNFGLYD